MVMGIFSLLFRSRGVEGVKSLKTPGQKSLKEKK